MADDEEAGAAGGTARGTLAEPSEPSEGLPPPERPWANADALNAKMRKAQRKRGAS